MSFEIKAATVDDRRRVVLPESCPPKAAVTIQEVDKDTWVIKRHRKTDGLVFVAIERIERLPDDPEWEKKELAIARHLSGKVPPPRF